TTRPTREPPVSPVREGRCWLLAGSIRFTHRNTVAARPALLCDRIPGAHSPPQPLSPFRGRTPACSPACLSGHETTRPAADLSTRRREAPYSSVASRVIAAFSARDTGQFALAP